MTPRARDEDLEVRLALAHERLVEWGMDLHYPGWDVPYSSPVLDRMTELARDHRLKRQRQSKWARLAEKYRRRMGLARTVRCKETAGPRMEIVVVDGIATACPPDGGVGRMVDRMHRAIARGNRTNEIAEIYTRMPEGHRTVVRCTYLGYSPRDVPREPEPAAAMMGVSRATYFRRRRALLTWVADEIAIQGAQDDQEAAA